jgi:hypothetical protein
MGGLTAMMLRRRPLTTLRRFWQNTTRRMRVILAGGLALLIAAAGAGIAWGVIGLARVDHSCLIGGATYVTHQGAASECVGVTDGSFDFDPRLHAVEQDILKENKGIVAAHPDSYVSVVLLLPISASATSILSMANAIQQLRGAYTAQHHVNRDDVEGRIPYIQLLIASNGDQANQWSAADDAIENLAAAQHVDAVTGLGVSLDQTEAAARQLTSWGLPVVGATITSDHFDNIKNLIRVSPDNQDAISVAVDYARTASGFTRAELIEDESTNDTYDATVVAAFKKYPDNTHQIVGKELYDTSFRNQQLSRAARAQAEQIVKNRISQMPADICLAQPAVVLFAGRGQDLAELVADLANRPCGDKSKPITIISGDDVTNLPFSPAVSQGLQNGVSVVYAGVANLDEWSAASGPGTAQGRSGFAMFSQIFRALFPAGPSADSNTMMAYDAALTAVSAIRLTLQPQPSKDAVIAELSALHGSHTVSGASGPIAFTADYLSGKGSNPIGKAIPMLALNPDGSSKFESLAWPDGQVPTS